MRLPPSAKFAVLSRAAVFFTLVLTTGLAQTNPPVITSSTNTLGTVGQPFTYQITASGNPTSFSAFALPAGLLAPTTNATITGLPQRSGTFASQIMAVNSNSFAVTNLSIQINPPPAPTLAGPVTVFGVQGQPLSYALLSTPNHSNVPTTFSVSGLPAGATLISNVTTNTSYPNVLVTNYFINSPSLLTTGSFIVPVVVSNQGGVSTNNVTFLINGTNPPVFTGVGAVTATVGVPFNYDVTAVNSPLRFRVTSIQIGANPPVVGLNITNGPITNGLSFSNASSGSTVVGRIYGTPGAANVITLGLEAANNFGTAATNMVINIGNPAPTVILSQPLGEGNYVNGSSFFLNAQAFDEPDNILVPSSYQFQENGNPLPGSVGIFRDYFGLEYDPAVNPSIVTASALNALGQTTNSLGFGMSGVNPQAPMPSIEMLPLNFGQQLVAGGKVVLSAQATIPSATTTIQRVEFYVNKVYVGSSTAPEPDTAGVYEYEWTTPTTPGSFQVTARAVSINFTQPVTNIPFWASVIARKPTIVNTKQGTAPSVAITSPANNGILNVGVPNRIKAAALLPGGSIESVEFFANGKRITSSATTPNPDLQNPFEVDFTPNSFGVYELYAVATGSNGLQTVSPSVIANVPSGSVPTVKILSPTKDITIPQTPISIRWVASDSDGSVQRAELRVNGATAIGSDGQPLVIDRAVDPALNPGSAILRYVPPSQGTYKFVVRVTDNDGDNQDSDPITVTVDNDATNILPIVAMTHPVPAGQTNDGQIDNVNDFSVASRLYLNAEVILPDKVNVDKDSDVKFFAGGQELIGTVKRFGNTFSIRWQPPARGEYFIVAQVTDSRGLVASSEPLFFEIGDVSRPLAQIELSALANNTATVGSSLVLQARSNQGTQRVNRIDFYANGVFIGTAEPRDANNTWVTTTFPWSPSEKGTYALSARAVQTVVGGAANGSDNSVISGERSLEVKDAVGTAPLVSLRIPPVAETYYVSGSQLFFNATVSTAASNAIAASNGVQFYFGTNVLTATDSRQFFNGVPVYSVLAQAPEAGSNEEDAPLFATARDTNNNISSSSTALLGIARSLNPLPAEVEMFPVDSLAPLSPGSVVKLRAAARFPAQANGDARVEFYINNTLVALGVPNATLLPDGRTLYEVDYVIPDISSAKGEEVTFEFRARAIALNYQTSFEFGNVRRYFGSVASGIQAATVYYIPSAAQPGSNERFVVDYFQKLVFRKPTYTEYQTYLALLQAGASQSQVIVAMARSEAFNGAQGVLFGYYLRMGMRPASYSQVSNYVREMTNVLGLAPLSGAMSAGISNVPLPPSPYGATVGQANVAAALIDVNTNRWTNNMLPKFMDESSYLLWMQRSFNSPYLPQTTTNSGAIGFPASVLNTIRSFPSTGSPVTTRYGHAYAFMSALYAEMPSSFIASASLATTLSNFPSYMQSVAVNYLLTPNNAWQTNLGPLSASNIAPLLPPVVTNVVTNSLLVARPYSLQLAGQNFVTNLTKFSASNLPTGLAINANNGLISGTPVASLVYTSAITASNGPGAVSTNNLVFSVSTLSGAQGAFVPIPPSTSAAAVNGVELGQTQLGVALRQGGSAKQLVNAGQFVGSLPGWTPLAAAPLASGYELFWRHNDGRLARWILDSNAARISSGVISSDQLAADEGRLGYDINNDGLTGAPFTSVRNINGVEAGRTRLGFALRHNGSIKQLVSNGAFVASLPGWTPLGAVSSGAGYEIFWRHNDGRFARWVLDANAVRVSSGVITRDEFLAREAALGVDLANRQATFVALRNINGVEVGTNSLGYALRHNGSVKQLVSNGAFVALLPGWSPLGAVSSGAGYELFWRHNDGRVARWELDNNGIRVSSGVIPADEFLAREIVLGVDLANRQATFVALRNINGVEVGTNSLGYALRHNGSVKQLVSNGAFVASLPGWNPLGAVSSGAGYELFWRHNDGRFARWVLNANAARVSSGVISDQQFRAAELTFATDFDKDGVIGPK